LAEAVLQDSQIAAIALRVARRELGEELAHRRAITQPIERQPPVRERRRLADRDHRLDDTPQLFSLRQRGRDALVPQQRYRHVAEHREPVTRGFVQLAQAVTVTHLLLPYAR